jgi:chlorite dismutase
VKPQPTSFVGGPAGRWEVVRLDTLRGPPLPPVARVEMIDGDARDISGAAWILRGVTSNERYVTRPEHDALRSREAPLGRAAATHAALIPITKSSDWWELPHDERRAIFEESSHHIAIGFEYLPAIARRLHHGRDLGEEFDFLTWFEYAPGDGEAFEELVERLRSTPEWEHVDREIDLRLERRAPLP